MRKRINKQQIFNFYNKTHKWHGLIDYKSLTVLAVYIFLCIYLVINMNITSTLKLYVIIILVLPVIIFTLLNINEDCVIEKLVTIVCYLLSKRVYTKSIDFKEKKTIYKKNVENSRIEK